MHKIHFMDVTFINMICACIYLFQENENVFHKYAFFFSFF